MTSLAAAAEVDGLHDLVRAARRTAATKPGDTAVQTTWAEMLTTTAEPDICPAVVDQLVELADRAHRIWFGEPLPRGDGPLTNRAWNTIGWIVARYGGLSEWELAALAAAGAPRREDCSPPLPEHVRASLVRAVAP